MMAALAAAGIPLGIYPGGTDTGRHKMSEKILCIYHHNCMDGFGAASMVKHYYYLQGREDILFAPGIYGKPMPEAAFLVDTVFVVDFSFPAEEFIRLASSPLRPRIIVLDHHKSAQKDLQGLDAVLKQYNSASSVCFDMERSGTGMTHDYFFAQKRSAIVQAIEDRDLWKNHLQNWPDIRSINSYLFSFPYDLEGDLFEIITDKDPNLAQIITEGEAIDRKQLKDCQELVANNTRWGTVKLPNGRIYTNIPYINVPKVFASDCGGMLAQQADFAVTYSDVGGTREFSLRGNGCVDVSEICKMFGGGGHANAAGFKKSLNDIGSFDLTLI